MNDCLFEVLVFSRSLKRYINPDLRLYRFKDACSIRDKWNSTISSDDPHFGYAITYRSMFF